MKLFVFRMRNTLLLATFLTGFFHVHAQFQFGENPGYYGTQFTDQQLYDLMYAGGARAARSTVSFQYYLQYGMSTYQARLQYPYSTKGMRNNTFFLDCTPGPAYTGQSDSTSTTGAQSWVPNGLWLPAFNSDGSINTNNLWALYCYNVVQSIGSYFTYFEVWNEPDLTGSVDSYEDSSQDATSWQSTEPNSGELPNLNAPLEDYVQLCKIANQVIKNYQPNAKIATGGLGYPWFYMWFLKKGGGQWVDELSIHFYPYFDWVTCSWTGSACGPAGFHRNSDYAVSTMTQQIASFRAIETQLGTPHLPMMMTESNIPRWSYVSAANLENFPNNKPWGSDETQKDYTIKAFTKMMEGGLNMFYLFQTGETGDSGLNDGTTGSEIDAMGMYKNLTKATPTTAVLTDQGIAIQTMQKLMNNYTVDATQPTFPSGIDGVRFDSSGNKIYVVWAITTLDMSETASGTDTLPTGISFKEYKFDGSSPGTVSGTVSLTGEPVFLVQTSGSISSVNCNAGGNQSITLPTSTVTLNASASTVTGSTISSYAWTQVSGPNPASVAQPDSATTIASNLVAGIYNFQLNITDSSGDSCSSIVQITVQATATTASGLQPVPVLATSQTITLPTNSIWLIGSGSYEPGGSIASYSWTQISGPTNVPIVSNTQPTILASGLTVGVYVFQLTITDSYGVTATTTTTITVLSNGIIPDATVSLVDSATGLILDVDSTRSKQKTDNKLLLYPNPSQTVLNLQVNTDTGGILVIRIFSISGQLMLAQQDETIGNYHGSIDISGLASGAYTMQVQIGSQEQLTAKFLKQ